MDEVIKVFKNLKGCKVVGGDIPTKILKECKFIFDIITACINKAIETGNFPDIHKMANVLLFLKKRILLINQTTDRYVFCHCYQKFMKGLYTVSCQNIRAISSMNVFVVSVRLIVHSMRFSNCFNHGKIIRLWRILRDNTNGFIESL